MPCDLQDSRPATERGDVCDDVLHAHPRIMEPAQPLSDVHQGGVIP